MSDGAAVVGGLIFWGTIIYFLAKSILSDNKKNKYIKSHESLSKKVYCEDCTYLKRITVGGGDDSYIVFQCRHPSNSENKKTKTQHSDYSNPIHKPSIEIGRQQVVYLKSPEEINKNNNCRLYSGSAKAAFPWKIIVLVVIVLYVFIMLSLK